MGYSSTISNPQTVRDLVVGSVRPEHVIGFGSEGVVYPFASEDPFFGDYVIKRRRLFMDLPWNNERTFAKRLKENSALTPTGQWFGGHNYGQPILEDSGDLYAIHRRQPGVPVGKLIRDGFPARKGWERAAQASESRYQSYLRWLMEEVPDASFLDLADKIIDVKAHGYALDYAVKDNLLWNDATQHFELIDLFDASEGKPFSNIVQSILKRPVKIPYLADSVVKRLRSQHLTVGDEIYKLLICEPLHLHGIAEKAMRSAPESIKISELEYRLRVRIDNIVQQRDVSPEKVTVPATQVCGGTVEHIGHAPINALKERLLAIAAGDCAGHFSP